MDNQYKNINFKELCNELGPEFIQKMNEVQTKEDEQDFNSIRDGLKKGYVISVENHWIMWTRIILVFIGSSIPS